MLQRLKSLFRGGFFHIFGADLINKAIFFIANILIVRFLTQDEYGVFTYANTIYTIIGLFSGFGLLSGMLQFSMERRSEGERTAIYKYALTKGIFVDCFLGLIILLVGVLVRFPIAAAGPYLACMSALILFDYGFQYIATALRSKKLNQSYATLQVVNAAIYSIGSCVGAWLGGIIGTIIGRYCAYALTICIGIAMLHANGFRLRGPDSLTRSRIKELWAFSVPNQMSACLNQLNIMLNVFLVGFFLASEADVAIYNVAAMIPDGLLFVPRCLMVFAAPIFIEHNHDKQWLRRHSALLTGFSSAFYAGLSLVLFLAAPFIIVGFWGEAYAPAIVPFQILLVGLALASIRTTCVNILSTLRAVKANLVVSIASIICNAIFCVLLIPRFGVVGSACALVGVYGIAALISAVLLARALLSASPKEDSALSDGR